MSTTKMHFFRLCDIFENVVDVFTGSYSNDNVELKKMRNELSNEDIPSVNQDRRNLRKDSSNVVKDYRKAVDEKKSEYCLHG